MSPGVSPATSRVLVVGTDADVSISLHLHLERAGCSLVCLGSPGEMEAVMRAVAPHMIVLMLPASPDATWGNALTAAANAAKVGIRVVVVAPSREIVEPLAAVAGAERALSRAEVLTRPTAVIERIGGGAVLPAAILPPPAPEPQAPARYAVAAAPSAPVDLAESPSRPRTPRKPSSDLLAMIDEELVDEPRNRPVPSLVEVNVSLVSEHNFYVGPSKRIDSGGVFIATALPPPVGTHLTVRLGLADGRKLDLEGDVTFVREKAAMMGRQPAGCGVKLASLPGWASDAIERFMQARQPILYSPR